MKKTVLMALVGLALWWTADPARAGEKSSIASIEARSKEFVAAWNEHDFKKMSSFWSQDGDLINPFGRVARGRAEVLKLFQVEQTGVMKGTTYEITKSSIRLVGENFAIADWESSIAGMPGSDGQPALPFRHHVTFVLRQMGNQWWIEAARAEVFAAAP
jgi:uncharacterized protein (TIGR02246 family)